MNYKDENIEFSIYQTEKMTRFSNNTDYKVFVSLIPEKPKRRKMTIEMIGDNSWKCFEEKLDLTKLSFRFEAYE